MEIVIKDPLTPIEVKASDTLSPSDLRSIKYFIKKFSCKQGIIFYNGVAMKIENINFVPFDNLLMYEPKVHKGKMC